MIWNLEKYKLLAKICNKILGDNKNDIYFLSNDIFYILREHKVVLSKYEPIFKKNFYLKYIFIFIKLFISSFLKIFIYLLVKKKQHHFNQKNYLFISHILNKDHEKILPENDFYFSHITKNLKNETYNICKIAHYKKKNTFFLNQHLGFYNELKIFFYLICNTCSLLNIFFKSKEIERKVIFLAIACNFSQSHFQNIRIYNNMKFLIEKIKPKKVITTFEGHPYERMIFSSVSDKSSDIKKIGFQHSILFKNQNTISLDLANQNNPDIILTAGTAGKSFFIKNKINEKIIVDVIGSNRYQKKEEINNRNIHTRNILFIPEGHHEENLIFIKAAKDILKLNKDIQIIFRFHPILYHNAVTILQREIADLSRVKISKEIDPNIDFRKCGSFLYRGSTLAVQAARFGLLPIYYDCENEININPFYEYPKCYKTVKSTKDLNIIIEKNNYSNNDNHFTDVYFSNIQHETLNKYF